MKYKSTRGGVLDQSFVDSMLSGYLTDGGITLPDTIPRVPSGVLASWVSLSYPELCKKVLPIFIDSTEISEVEICDIIDKSFTSFEHPDEVVRVHDLQNGVSVGELYHGPTGAFKDLALSILGQCLDLVLAKRKQKVTVLVGTSGDTGGSAIRSVCNSEWVNIIVLYPSNMVSEIQRLQMTTVDAPNVQVFATEGTSDDLDVPIKEVFRDTQYVERHHLCSINSINIGRVLFQCIHYLYLYFRIHGADLDRRLPFYIPTGAAGHITGGMIARALTGLDLELIACVNENDIVHRWLETGLFKANAEVVQTSSNAMDIQVPYNIERLLFFLSDGDCELVKRLMADLESEGSFTTPPELRRAAAKFMRSHRVTEEERMATMREISEKHAYLLCPHTAIAVRAALHSPAPDSPPRVCLATATVAKFPDAARKAGITQPIDSPKSWQQLHSLKELDKPMARRDNWEQILRQAIELANAG